MSRFTLYTIIFYIKEGKEPLMSKKVLILTCGIIALIFVLSAVAIIGMNFSGTEKRTAEIYQDGRLLYTIDLDHVNESYEITVTGENGAYNIILAEPGQISMKEASCPDKLCVHMGKIHNASLPVTCLPNKVVIRIIPGTDTDSGAPDAVAY